MFNTKDFRRDKSGAAFSAPQGYTNSGYWSFYANSFAEDGSEDQLIAALTKSVPTEWLASRNLMDDSEWYNPTKPNDGKRYKDFFQDLKRTLGDQGGLGVLDRTADQWLDSYTRGLQSRLRNQFKSEKKGMEDQGTANLRDQAQDMLSDDFKNIDADANARGLLFSGKRQSARSSAAAQRAGELGGATTDYLQSIGDMERGLNSDIFRSEIDSSLRQADINDLMSGSLYNKMRRKIGTSQAEAQAAQNFGSGVGSITGALAGRLQKRQGGNI